MERYWPMALVVIANVFYNICAKQTPENADPFLSLVITYAVAMLVSLGLYFFSAGDKNIVRALSRLDWTSYVFGLSIVGLEFGYLNIYRAGWSISTASLIANISLAVVLIVIGVVFYRDALSLRKICGMIACLVGLVLIGK